MTYRKRRYHLKFLFVWLLLLSLTFTGVTPYMAEEEYYEDTGDSQEDYSSEEETEFIPETYYDPIQSNDIKGWPQGQAIQAAAGVVMDLDSGVILYSKNADQTHFPASITKLLTALVVVENTKKLNEVMCCGDEVYAIEADSSNCGLQPGEEITVKQGLYALMLESANDAAMVLAKHTAGSVEAFADMMNQKAAELGCTNSHFVNPNGLHNENHYTTARDMALIGAAAYANKKVRKIISATEYMLPETNIVEEDRYFGNHHKMLQPSSDYYYDIVTAGKTGFTTDAWNTLVTFAEKDGRRLVCVLLRENGAGKAYLETRDLLDYGFDNFSYVDVPSTLEQKNFYQIMDLNSPDLGTTLEVSPKMMENAIVSENAGRVLLPNGVGIDALQRKSVGDGSFIYTYEGIEVGSGSLQLNPIPTDITYSFEEKRDAEEITKNAQTGKLEKELRETADQAISNVKELSGNVWEIIQTYTRENMMTVILAGAFVLVVLIVLIFIMILRCTKDYRMQRKRDAEEAEIERAQEEIERKSAVEIEEELRAALAAEQERENRKRARAEQMREVEDELAETERIIAEHNRKSEGK